MKNKSRKRLGDIYLTFLKLGCIGFGGGYSMIPLIEREVVEKKGWVEKDKMADLFAVAGSLPGAIALNTSTFVGYTVAGISGGVSALLGSMTPSVIIMLALSILFHGISGYAAVKSAFTGIYPVIIGMILYAAYKIGKTAVADITGVVILIFAFILLLLFHLDPIPLIVAGSVAGVVITTVKTAHRHAKCKKQEQKDSGEKC